MTSHPCLIPSKALDIANSVLATRYEGAAFAYVAGSIMRGDGALHSDIDMVVIHERVEAARRESFIAQGVPVEAFVHDRETLAWFVEDDVSRGRPLILNMVAEGVVIGPDASEAETVREMVAARLAAGPPPLSQVALNALRYEITNVVDDLRDDRPPDEVLAIGASLHPKLIELALRGRGVWYGTGKWGPRLLAGVSADLSQSFDRAFRMLFTSGDCGPVIALANAEMARHGGWFFDGDRRVAPATCRLE